MNEVEEWRDIPEYEGQYQVSNFGRVRSLARWSGLGRGRRWMKERILVGFSGGTKGEYLIVGLWKNSKVKMIGIHRLVLEVFVGPCPEGMECRHFPDRDPTNNMLSNLSWSSHVINIADKITHGTSARGEKQGRSKLKTHQVLAIRLQRSTTDITIQELAEQFEISHETIKDVVHRKTWKHI